MPRSDTTVAVSRAAEKPLPPPPPGSTWERIEQVRRDGNIKYSVFSNLAERSPAQYRNVATRGWGATQDVVDSFVRACVGLGYSEVWLRVGQGEPKLGAREAAKKAFRERRDRRQDAIDRLVRHDGVPERDAERLVDDVGDKPGWQAIYDQALEAWDVEQFKKQREARRLRERSLTPAEPPSVHTIGKRRKVRVHDK
jgi:hypothetical protein